MCCDITVWSTIAYTASSFSFNLSENPASNCGLFVNESVVKLSKQRTEFLLMWSRTKNKVNPLIPNTGIRRKAMQVFPQLGNEQRLVVFGAIFIICFCIYSICVIYTMCLNRWAGLNRWRCRSRCWSSEEVVFSHIITSCIPQPVFRQTGFNISCF